MRVIAVLVAFLVLSDDAAADPGLFRDLVASSMPIAHWCLNEPPGSSVAVDVTGNGHDGVYTGTVTLGQSSANGLGVTFDGGRVTVPYDAVFSAPAVSIQMIVTRSRGSDTSRIIDMGGTPGGAGSEFAVSLSDRGAIQVDSAILAEGATLASPNAIAVGVPAHIVVSVSYGPPLPRLRSFVDGVNVASGNIPFGRRASVGRPLLIANDRSGDRPFLGLIDEVVLYDRELTTNEVLRHYLAIGLPSRPGGASPDSGGSDTGTMLRTDASSDAAVIVSVDAADFDAGPVDLSDAAPDEPDLGRSDGGALAVVDANCHCNGGVSISARPAPGESMLILMFAAFALCRPRSKSRPTRPCG